MAVVSSACPTRRESGGRERGQPDRSGEQPPTGRRSHELAGPARSTTTSAPGENAPPISLDVGAWLAGGSRTSNVTGMNAAVVGSAHPNR
jgi:hypothetical protein